MLTSAISANCVICGLSFLYERPARGRRQKYCSAICRQARQSGKRREARADLPSLARSRVKTIQKLCVICGGRFLTAVRKQDACGQACGGRLAKLRGDAGRLRNSLRRRMRICESCDLEFVMRNPSGNARAGRAREGRFCSVACRYNLTPICEALP